MEIQDRNLQVKHSAGTSVISALFEGFYDAAYTKDQYI